MIFKKQHRQHSVSIQNKGELNNRLMETVTFFFHFEEELSVTDWSQVPVIGVWKIEVNEQSKHWYL